MSTSFAAWALDKRRSREERFGAQLLIEHTANDWRRKHGLEVEFDFEAVRLRHKARSLNPAYESEFTATDAEHAEEVLPTVKSLSFRQWDDRPLRDLSILRFCPALESLSANKVEIRDWTPLRAVPDLRELHVGDAVARDFRPVAELAQLHSLHLTLEYPWPDLAGFERLEKLVDFDFYGNILALAAIPRLAGLRSAKFHQLRDFHVPLRRVSDLPHLPELRRLFLENTCQLDGLERSPLLLNLEVFGYFDDLAPLSSLEHLTHLVLSGGDYPSLAPIARLPRLQRLVLRREEPSDLSVLAETPRLHELRVELCPTQKAEVAILNSTLCPWSDEFIVDPPRPLQPLRLILRKSGDDPSADSAAAPRDWQDDHDMGESEARWFARQINRRLTALLGKGWGGVSESGCLSAGYQQINIRRPEDIDRLPEIVQALRELFAGARHPWTCLLIVNSFDEDEEDLDETDDEAGDKDEFNAQNEREEWEDRRERERERREYLEREYRYRLRQEQGLPTPPEEFAPPAEAPAPAVAEAVAEAVADDDEEQVASESDADLELHLYATVTEQACHVNPDERGLAEMLLRIKAAG